MYEMTAAELDAELAIELPDRALMKKAKISVKNATIKNSVLIAANQTNNLHQEAYGGNAYANGGNGNGNGTVDVHKAHDVWAQAQGGNGNGNGGTADASATNVAYQTNVIAVWNN